MEVLSFRFTCYGFLLLCAYWSVTDCSTTIPTAAPEVTSKTSPGTTAPPTTKPPIPDVNNITVVSQTETTITITFDKVPGVPGYMWYYFINGTQKNESFQADDNFTLHGLLPAQTYNMRLHSRMNNGDESPGRAFNATTAPEDVDSFNKVDQTSSSITLEWRTKAGVPLYILRFDGNEKTFTEGDPSNYTVPNLNSSTTYNFTMYCEFEDIRSTGVSLQESTAPTEAEEFQKINQNETSITLQWKNADPGVSYSLQCNDEQPVNFTSQELGDPATYTVPGLQNTTVYNFTLVTVYDNILGNGVSITAATAPRNAEGFQTVDQNETSITLQWEPVSGVMKYILRSVHGRENIIGKTEATVTNLESGTLHNFTLFSVFEKLESSGSSLTAPTVPQDATNFKAQTQTETSITLWWDKVGDIQDYELQFQGRKETISASAENVVTYVVPNLESGTLYDFTLKTNFTGLLSQGTFHQGVTVPPRVSSVKVVERNLNTIKLEWGSPRHDWEYELTISDQKKTIKPTGGSISHTVLSLSAGKVYPFNIKTIFHLLPSQLYESSTVTVIDCTKVKWNVTETSIRGLVDGAFTSATASNGSQQELNSGSVNEVKFSGLFPGAKYDMTLMYEELVQCRHSLHIVPPRLEVKCKNCKNGYSLCVEWNRPSGIWDYVEINVSDIVYDVGRNGELKAELQGYKPAQKYKASISSRSGPERSKKKDFTCATDASGVIAGSFFGVLLFLILLCVVVFVILRKPDIIRRYKSPKSGVRTSVRKSKGIPLEKFPAHFKMMSADENKGFTLEYENLSPVGTDQSRKAATAEENRAKNRFVNVLPYDRSRVKLTASAPNNDYINASYMPGYNSDREFIAAQGPTPSTVKDFWRMIWEQRVRGIVMVTNCTEGGRTKCEQYWADSDARVCGDLAVFTTSQKKDVNWTLREFTVKHRITAEERTVKHFHFTAWPDHGVPEGTEVLIQFRALVRKHIQMEAQGTPTVVHCSAGVGRTGTLIALDMLLQQLEREKMVDVNGFVHKMRLNRPYMVQTESQYVFLHQCVLDQLRLNEKQEESIYENELIYANATALREYQNNMNV